MYLLNTIANNSVFLLAWIHTSLFTLQQHQHRIFPLLHFTKDTFSKVFNELVPIFSDTRVQKYKQIKRENNIKS